MNTENERDSAKPESSKAYEYTLGKILRGWTWLLAKPERLTAISTFFIFLATAVAVGVGIAQWRALRSTDNAIREQLIASNRAWIDVEIELIGDLLMEPDAARVTIKYGLKNYGTAAATDVFFEPKFVLHDWGELEGKAPNIRVLRGPTHIEDDLFAFCEQERRGKGSTPLNKTNWLGGTAIFPTKEASGKIRPHIQLTDITKAAAQRRDDPHFWPYLITCAIYRFPTDTDAHYTGRAYELLKRDGGWFRPNENVALGNLRLEPVGFYGGSALTN
jgi:hypothetical protein